MRYVSDSDAHGEREFWQAPQETIARGTGDCEDFAIPFFFFLQIRWVIVPLFSLVMDMQYL